MMSENSNMVRLLPGNTGRLAGLAKSVISDDYGERSPGIGISFAAFVRREVLRRNYGVSDTVSIVASFLVAPLRVIPSRSRSTMSLTSPIPTSRPPKFFLSTAPSA